MGVILVSSEIVYDEDTGFHYGGDGRSLGGYLLNGYGPTGASAYEAAKAAGFDGTLESWLVSLQGPKGDRGLPGIRGTPGEAGSTSRNIDGGSAGTIYGALRSINGGGAGG